MSKLSSNGHSTPTERLSVLSQAPDHKVKALAEGLLPELGGVDVLENRTGLLMLPFTDSVTGITFHLGEVLVTEARVRLIDHDVEGYAACLGRDMQRALAIALLDAALRASLCVDAINRFASAEAVELDTADDGLLCQVDSTRVNLETF